MMQQPPEHPEERSRFSGAQALDLMRMGLGDPDESAPAPQLDGFELGAVIGRGGMGTVYLAHQRDLDRDVVVKLVSPDLAHDPEFAERFTREARLMAGLRHPNIVIVHQLATTDGGEIAIVMEHIAGGNLRDLLRAHPKGLPPAHARQLFREIASALGAAHALGVIHRDVKPENILLDNDGSVRVADFGLAVRPSDPTPRLTMSSATVGTADYMAPERFDSNEADVRSDIYALGVVFYEMLTGKVPRGSFLPPHRSQAGITRHLGDAVMKALRPEPDERFLSMRDFAAAADQASGMTRRWWLAGAAATLVVGTGAWLSTRQRGDESSISPSDLTSNRPLGTAPAAEQGQWHDLLARAVPSTHAISGVWQRLGNGIESDASICILSQEIALPADYDVRLSFTRLSGVRSVALFFTANGSTGTVDLDGWDQGLAGVQTIDGRDLRHGAGFSLSLEDGREYLLELEVRGGRIRVSVDGELRSEHSVGERALGVAFPWQWNPPVTASILGIGSYESPTRFHRFEWRSANGG